ncbi:hypothetical protein GUK30_37625 [Rhizobium leguminosarum]|nr:MULTISPECIES: hypothetical protein [Rhizobium]MBB4346264.1 hypothetical protein [Rhizobium leguminosarum]MBB5262880.1 hypothetical protein [Rhizobium leguminosarum]MBB6299382.1 hypothetical protein [Rhizobium leguminosarum]MBY5345710.1 hypothetical protein [Rhizobium leguminosarum]MBY5482813.1 hypothetical protein [Rhizobium leguminosarum]
MAGKAWLSQQRGGHAKQEINEYRADRQNYSDTRQYANINERMEKVK